MANKPTTEVGSTPPTHGSVDTANPLDALASQIVALGRILQIPEIKAVLSSQPMQELEYGIAAFRQCFPMTWANAIASTSDEQTKLECERVAHGPAFAPETCTGRQFVDAVYVGDRQQPRADADEEYHRVPTRRHTDACRIPVNFNATSSKSRS